MQTFLPVPDFAACAAALDRQRLGAQRREALQILHALDPAHPGKGWRNHPATRMWAGYEGALARYGLAMVAEWVGRGYQDTRGPLLQEYAVRHPMILPPWIGNEALHAAHRSLLLRKNPKHYRPLFPDTPDDLPFLWAQGATDV